jgi:hemolysin activation/secretion protein
MFPTFLSEDSVFRRKKLAPVAYYSNPDRAFIGLRFRLAKGRLGKNAEGYDQSIQLRYSVSQNSFSTIYTGNFYELLGKWNLSLNAYYDWLIWTNFTGLGNETRMAKEREYYRLSTSEYAINVGANRIFKDRHFVEVAANMQGIEVFSKPNTFIADSVINERTYYFEHHTYANLNLAYAYQDVDDHVLPTKGVFFYAGGGYTLNTYQPEKSFARYTGIAQVYIPLFSKFSLALRASGMGVSGTPEFYQYVTVGGPTSVRGYHRDRFWGNVSFYNSNELRYITGLRVRKWDNKVGLLVLFDNGRVWLDNEQSNKLHYGYGGGILISPAAKFTLTATYTRSEEAGVVQFRMSRLLNRTPPGSRRQQR